MINTSELRVGSVWELVDRDPPNSGSTTRNGEVLELGTRLQIAGPPRYYPADGIFCAGMKVPCFMKGMVLEESVRNFDTEFHHDVGRFTWRRLLP